MSLLFDVLVNLSEEQLVQVRALIRQLMREKPAGLNFVRVTTLPPGRQLKQSHLAPALWVLPCGQGGVALPDEPQYLLFRPAEGESYRFHQLEPVG